MLDLLSYTFITRGLEAGLVIGFVAPLIGIFLVLRRYSLIADTLSHVSLAGVAVGLLLNINPVVTALFVAIGSSAVIEKLRTSKRISGESALAIFLSGSLAVALIIISLAHGFTVDLFNYLFGSILTVRSSDVLTITLLSVTTAVIVFLFYKELVFVSFDEEAARVAGLPTKFINLLLIVLAATVVAVSIPIVGVLLIAALIVVPVSAALQFGQSFQKTLVIAEVISLFSVGTGVILSFALNFPTGATIVLVTLAIFVISLSWPRN